MATMASLGDTVRPSNPQIEQRSSSTRRTVTSKRWVLALAPVSSRSTPSSAVGNASRPVTSSRGRRRCWWRPEARPRCRRCWPGWMPTAWGPTTRPAWPRPTSTSITPPPPDFDLEQALTSLQKFRDRSPAGVALAHYGLVPDPMAILDEANDILRKWTEVAEKAWRNGEDIATALDTAFAAELTDVPDAN